MNSKLQNILTTYLGDIHLAQNLQKVYSDLSINLVSIEQAKDPSFHVSNHDIVIGDVDKLAEQRYQLYRLGIWKYHFFDLKNLDANYSSMSLLYHLLGHSLSYERCYLDETDPYMSSDIYDSLKANGAGQEVLRRFSIVFHELCANSVIHGKQSSPTIHYRYLNDYVIVKIQDDAGKLKITDLQKIFYIKEKSKVNDESKFTAGIGYRMIEKYVHGLIIEVVPNERTTVTFVLNYKQTIYQCNFLIIKRD